MKVIWKILELRCIRYWFLSRFFGSLEIRLNDFGRKNLVGWPVHTCAISRATIVWVNKTSRMQNLHLIRWLNDFFGIIFFCYAMKFYYRKNCFSQCKMCFIQKKITFFQNSKDFFKKKHWEGPLGKRGWRGFTRKFLLSSKCWWGWTKSKHLGNDLLREVKCKNLASKLCAISKPYLKHYFGSTLCSSSSSQYKISCPTRVSLYPKAHSKVPLMYNTTILASVDRV